MSEHLPQTREEMQYTVSALYLGTSLTGPDPQFHPIYCIFQQNSASFNTCNLATFVLKRALSFLFVSKLKVRCVPRLLSLCFHTVCQLHEGDEQEHKNQEGAALCLWLWP